MTQKRIIALIVALVLLAGATAVFVWHRQTETLTGAHKEGEGDIYYCPMHPSVTSDKPGNCPICGMALVKRQAQPTATSAAVPTDASLAQITLSPEQRLTANVKTLSVKLDTHTGELVATGRVTFDERRVAQVTSYTAGRIERLFVNFTGDTVRRGTAVASIYSPDLYATQQEYLLALQNRDRMREAGFAGARTAADDLVESTRRRLQLFGMNAGQIAELEHGRKPLYTTAIISPVSGIVTNKLAVEQQYVAQGQPILEVADLSNVWVEADVYEQQLPQVQVGQKVEITSPATPGQTFTGTVSFIQPVLSGATRTAQVRIDLPNRNLRLKPDMYVNVRIVGIAAPPHIMVPASAVIDRGQKQYIWTEVSPNSYEPRPVVTGGRHGEMVVIAAGLQDGDVIVVEGGFLLDSEAQLRGATSGGGATTTVAGEPTTMGGGHEGH